MSTASLRDDLSWASQILGLQGMDAMSKSDILAAYRDQIRKNKGSPSMLLQLNRAKVALLSHEHSGRGKVKKKISLINSNGLKEDHMVTFNSHKNKGERVTSVRMSTSMRHSSSSPGRAPRSPPSSSSPSHSASLPSPPWHVSPGSAVCHMNESLGNDYHRSHSTNGTISPSPLPHLHSEEAALPPPPTDMHMRYYQYFADPHLVPSASYHSDNASRATNHAGFAYHRPPPPLVHHPSSSTTHHYADSMSGTPFGWN